MPLDPTGTPDAAQPRWERIELPTQPEKTRAPRVPRALLAGGIGAAVVAGAVLGLMARSQPAPAPAAPSAASGTVPIEVVEMKPEPLPEPVGKLEVLPEDMARAAEVAARSPPPRPRVEPEPLLNFADEREMAVAVRPRAGADPSFNCGYARTDSEYLVCGDRELARLDRRLARAFDRALRAGVPFDDLRAEQDDWLAIREDAARHSPGAVASVYRQRIQELDALADDIG